MNHESVLFEELRPDQYIQRINACPIAYLPLGTLEWHGLHLPLGADGLQSRGVMVKIAERVGGIVLPMLFLGPDNVLFDYNNDYWGMDYWSFDEGKPQQLEGSAYKISAGLYSNILHAIMSNMKRSGFKAVVGHGHGPSTGQFAMHNEIFEKSYGIKCYTLWELGLNGDEGIQTDHAAFNETSIMLGLHPDLVDMSLFKDGETPVGVSGTDPRGNATHQTGINIIEKNVAEISEKLLQIVDTLKSPNRCMDYKNVKNLIKPYIK